MLFIDSNIWCYYFDKSSVEHATIASYLDMILGKKEIVLNHFIIMELAHYLIKNLGPLVGKEKIEIFLGFPFILPTFDHALLLTSIDLLARYGPQGIGGRDATILATMKTLGIKQLVTHDKAFRKIDFIDIIDPFHD